MRNKIVFWLWAVWALNLLDAVSTGLALRMGIAEELNPAMAALYDLGPPVFFWAKVCVVTLCLLALLKAAGKLGRSVLWCARGLSVAYLIVIGAHIRCWHLWYIATS